MHAASTDLLPIEEALIGDIWIFTHLIASRQIPLGLLDLIVERREKAIEAAIQVNDLRCWESEDVAFQVSQ